MKFGKQMAKIVALSDAEWAPFWISYKALKKRIKDLQRGGHGGGAEAAASSSAEAGAESSDGEKAAASAGGTCCVDRAPTPKDLACRAGEVAFFKTILAEIKKTTEFYVGMEQQMGARNRRIRQGIQYLKQPTTLVEADAWTRMRRACVSLYKDLLLLEHFAVMNYCACAKALKKHDKTVGIELRGRFMRNMMAQQPFTHYPRLLEMLQEVERTFAEINAIQGESARRLGEEERIFLDAIRGLRENQQQASTQAHSSDHGSAASDSSGDEEGGAGGGVGGVAVARQEEEEEEGETGAAGGALPLKKRRV